MSGVPDGADGWDRSEHTRDDGATVTLVRKRDAAAERRADCARFERVKRELLAAPTVAELARRWRLVAWDGWTLDHQGELEHVVAVRLAELTPRA